MATESTESTDPLPPLFFAGELGLPGLVSTRERTTTSQRIGDNPRFQRHQRCLAGIAEWGTAISQRERFFSSPRITRIRRIVADPDPPLPDA